MRLRRKYSARPFYVALLVISSIAALSLLRARGGHTRYLHREVARHLVADSSRRFPRRDQECRLVHTVQDKCMFVRANCPDEEAGLFSYLQLYYCRLHHAKPAAFTILVVWLGLLFSTIGIAASDFFCINLSTIASILGMSESMAGVTFLAFGNGSPDVFSTFAAMTTHSGSLAIGELIGAAGFITAVVAGSMALVRPFKVAKKSFIRDVGFFVVAASFSMIFLADGHLHLWECAVMVGFYIFYVMIVVVWHWYLGQRGRRKARDVSARAHFLVPDSDELEFQEEVYEDEDGTPSERRSLIRGNSTQDFDTLERAGSPVPVPPVEEADDETRDKWLAELSSNMRISRPYRGERRQTINPIRPSLVGALEFRAVLSSLQKSRNIQTSPINMRRYSDDPIYTDAHQQHHLSVPSDFPTEPENGGDVDRLSGDLLRPSPEGNWGTAANRLRAASASDAVGPQSDPNSLDRLGTPQSNLLDIRPPASINSHGPDGGGRNTEADPQMMNTIIPGLSITASPISGRSRNTSPISKRSGRPSTELLAPPREQSPRSSRRRIVSDELHYRDHENGGNTFNPVNSRVVPRLSIPQSYSSKGSSSTSPFPAYIDALGSYSARHSQAPSIRLPPPSLSSDSTYLQNGLDDLMEKPIRWWPYKVLPPPRILISTLFPTLYSWHDKNIWEKFLGIVSAPSVFLLAITLPVVEPETDDEASNLDLVPPSVKNAEPRLRSISVAPLPPESPTGEAEMNNYDIQAPRMSNIGRHGNHGLGSPIITGSGGHGNSATVAVATENEAGLGQSKSPQLASHLDPISPPTHWASSPSPSKEWNRWLVSTQIFTAPFFIVLLVWANTDDNLSAHNLVLPVLSSLLASLVVFALLLLTTTAEKPPRYRFLLCFVGFIVSIAWISTIANEVVGVLKAFGVILGISDAILGLTIFAVGNSLGDLVADITVARLGYPVMALSACFGGPMLNILLGVGISGLYMTISAGEGRHERHPNTPIKFKPYQIDVSSTLVISGITLLVTLLGLLIAVPLNGWKMDKKIGYGLIALWSFSTVGNVLMEILGVGGDIA